jgi:hypothetical protein
VTQQDAVAPQSAGALLGEGSGSGVDPAEEAATAEDAMNEPISDDWMEMDEEIGPAQPAAPPSREQPPASAVS